MALLLDTCAMVFFGENTGDLSEEAMLAIETRSEAIFVSALSVAELACAQERGRLKLRTHWKQWWNGILERNGWEVLPLTADIMAEAWSLPGPVHGDPADRLLIATARIERMTIITTDQKILSYPHVSSRG